MLLAMLLSLLAPLSASFIVAAVLFYALAAGAARARISPRSARQSMLLVALGAGLNGYALFKGAHYQLASMLGANLSIVSMLVAVSFLPIVSKPSLASGERLPRGRRSAIGTFLSVHLFGAIINISSLQIHAERLAANRPISKAQLVLLSRGFTCAAFWSPFFAAMAVALSYAPHAQILTLIPVGIGLCAFALGYTYVELSRAGEMREFYGYPLRLESLWLPCVLTLLVFAFHYGFADLSILYIITFCAPLLCLAVLCFKGEGVEPLKRHAQGPLSKMGNEIVLFLSAGFFGYGIQQVLAVSELTIFVSQFDFWAACGAYLFIVLLAMLGFHMVIGISIVAPVLLPLDPPHTVLAFVFLAAWGLGSAVSPLSGVNISLQGRFDVTGNTLLRWNLRYALAISTVTIAVLWVWYR